MASAVTSIYEYPISAASAAYAPTNTAEVTGMIDSAVSGKLDASASSAFITSTAGLATTAEVAEKLDSSASSAFITSTAGCQPSGDYVSSSELADYQTTAGMSGYASTADLSAKLDVSASSSFVTSTADCMPLSASGNYATTGALSAKLDASAQVVTSISADTSVYRINSLPIYTDWAGRAGYASTADYASTVADSAISSKLDASAVGTSTAGVTGIGGTAIAGGGGASYSAGNYIQISGDEISVTGIDPASYASTADLSAKLDSSAQVVTAIGKATGFPGHVTSINSRQISAFTSQYAGTAQSAISSNYAATVAASAISSKLDASASSEFITSTADCMPLSSSGEYQTTAGMSGYASTADLADKLDASASSTFITSTAGLVSTGDLSAYLETSSIDLDSASAITGIAGSAIAGGGGVVVTATATREWVNGALGGTTALSSVNNTPVAASYLLTDTRWSTEPSASGGSYAYMTVNPLSTPFTATSGIYGPLAYATGAVLTFGSMLAETSTSTGANGGKQKFGGFFKGNEIYISDGEYNVQQCLRMETHKSRGVHVSGTDALHSSYFNLSTAGVGISSTSGTATFDLAHFNTWNGKLDTSAIETSSAGITGISGTALAIGVVTDIIQTSSLPTSTVPTVLYLIPET